MNRPIRRIAIAFMIMFFALLANVNYIQAFQAEDLNNNADNRRVLLEEYSRQRGSILVEGERVAYSVKTDDELPYLRKYEKTDLYALLTGYYSSLYGGNLIERNENDLLSGTDDRLFVRRMVDMLADKPPRGGSVLLTLDREAQQAAVDGLRGKKGAVVALEPETGAVLAMASLPTYDPNKLASHDTEVQEEAWQRWAIDNPDKPMNNRATQFTYPPGSTFKIVTAAAALESGRYEPDSELPAPKVLDLPLSQNNLHNWQRGLCSSSDEITLTVALETSCNTAFGKLGLELGDDALHEQAQRFGFGEAYLPVLLGAESHVPEKMDQPETALSAIGQYDVQATPLQMAMVSAAVANSGELMKPYVIAKRTAPNTEPLDITEPEALGQAVSPDVADQLSEMMVSVVDDGTGEPGQIDGMKVAGKTGTAQTTPDRPPYAWFVSFAPADQPEVAVAVLIEEADVGRSEISGGKLAAPIAKSVMEAVINQ